MSKKNPEKNTMAMTAQSVGADLLQALVQEVKLLPDVWPKLSQRKQDDIIERLRKRVITVKDGIKAVLTMSKNDPNRHGLMDAQGKSVLIAIADAEDHMGDVAAVRGTPDQRAMDLGHEYDPDGDGNGMDGDDITDAQILGIGDNPMESELEQAYQDGREAAELCRSKSDCPVMRHELVAQWTKGWTDWHEEQNGDVQAP